MRFLTVDGLSGDGRTLLLRDGREIVGVALSDVHRAEPAPATPTPTVAPPTPREIQQRIRVGETAAEIARTSGLQVSAVARYEGPPLAEREHQGRRARDSLVDGRAVEDLVGEHFARIGVDAPVAWDCWLVESGKWELRARSGRVTLRLRWDALAARVRALDEPGRSALRLGPVEQDLLGAVLRPTSRVASGERFVPSVVDLRPVEPMAVPGSVAVAGPVPEPVAAPRPDRPFPATLDDVPLPFPEPAPVRSAAHAKTSGPAPEDGVPVQEPAVPAPGAGPGPSTGPRPAPGRLRRASVPTWDDISGQVAGRGSTGATTTRRPERPQQPEPGSG